MRTTAALLLFLLALGSYSCGRSVRVVSFTPAVSAQATQSISTSSAKVDFATHVEPLLKSKCQPCHFNGGKVYDKLPFDRPATIKTLGTKLFTRLQDENDRKVIREFLSQP
jgi:uncharacterized cupredoxin-like copper-binding protein